MRTRLHLRFLGCALVALMLTPGLAQAEADVCEGLDRFACIAAPHCTLRVDAGHYSCTSARDNAATEVGQMCSAES